MKEYLVIYCKKTVGGGAQTAQQVTEEINRRAKDDWQVLSVQFDAVLQNCMVTFVREA